MPPLWTHRKRVGYTVIDCPVCFDLREAEAFRCHRQLIPRSSPPKHPKHPAWHELVCRTCGFRERLDEPEISTSNSADLPLEMLIEDHRPEIVELAAEREAREGPVLDGKASPSEREAVLAARVLEMKPAYDAAFQKGMKLSIGFCAVLGGLQGALAIGVVWWGVSRASGGQASPISVQVTVALPHFIFGLGLLFFGAWVHGQSDKGLPHWRFSGSRLLARSLAPFGVDTHDIVLACRAARDAGMGAARRIDAARLLITIRKLRAQPGDGFSARSVPE